ncbi:hypothetical protein AABM34_02705 [Lysinibacillus fusiformis]
MFTFLTQPIIYFVHFIHSFTGSYAIGVISITIAVRAVLMPLFIKSVPSTKNIQKN